MEHTWNGPDKTPAKIGRRSVSRWSPGFGASPTRASSGPPASQRANGEVRSMHIPMVFDMAASDAEAGHGLEGSLAGACGEPKQTLRCTASPQDGALSPSGSSITQVPSSLEDGSSATPHNCTELQGDVWSLQDWGSPQSLGSQGSPCNGALKFDKTHRDVADAVAAELQVDLQSATNRAIDQMSSWVSQEIAHARKGIEEDMHNACIQGQEQQAREHEFLRNSHIELVWKFEQLQSRMDGRMQTLEDLCCRVADERRCSEPRAAGSAQVQEAWKVAEERKWRMKLDDLQASLDRASDNIEMLGRRACNLEEKAVGHEADIERNTQAFRSVQSQMMTVEKGRLAAQANIDKRFENIESIRQQCSRLVERVAAHDADLQTSTNVIKTMEERLVGEREDALAVQATVEALRMQGLEARLIAVESERLSTQASLDRHCERAAGMEETLSAQAKSIEGLEKQYEGLAESVSAQDTGMKSSTQSMEKTEAWLSFAEAERVAMHETLDQHSEKFEKLDKQYIVLSERVDGHDTDMRRTIDALEDVCARSNVQEDKILTMQACVDSQVDAVQTLAEKSNHLVEGLVAHRIDIQNGAHAIQAVEMNLAVGEKERVLVQERLDEQLHRLGMLREQLGGLAEHVSAHDLTIRGVQAQVSSSMKERLAELRVVCDQLEQHEAVLDVLPNRFQALGEDVVVALGDLTNSFGGKLNSKVEKSSLEASLACHDDRVTAWVNEARQSHDVMVDNLYEWLGEHRASITAQASALQRHEEWMSRISKWLEQVRVREQGLTGILCEALEHSTPELVEHLERILAVPQFEHA